MKQITRKVLALTALLAVTAQAQAYDIRSSLVSYYPFETSTTEDAANDNDFTAFNSPTLLTTDPAPRSSALQLDGVNQYLRMDHSTDHTLSGFPVYNSRIYSVAMWVKAPAQVNRFLFTHGSSTSSTPLFMLQTGNSANSSKLDAYLRTDLNTALLNHVASTNVVFDNTWHHVAWVDNNGEVSVYIDGVLDPANFSYIPGGTYTWDRTGIGALVRSSPSGYLNGAVDDVAVFERALTQSEVQEIMTNGITTPVPALPPVITAQPASVTKNFQDTVIFSVRAAGTRPNHVLTYQWNKNGSPIPDATDRTYKITHLTTDDSGDVYSVTIDSGAGDITSADATLTVLADGPADLRAGIISYWPLDEVSNDAGAYSTIDLYSRNDFSLTNMSEFNVEPGQFGSSLLFDNLSNTHAVRSGGAAVYNYTGYSVSMWVKADGSFQPDVRVYSEGSNISDAPLFTIGVSGGGTNTAFIYIRGDDNRAVLARSSTRVVFDGNWHHIVWTDNNGVAKLYVDGALDETDFNYTPSTLTLNVSALGAVVRKSVGNMIYGNIDEVATWTRPITYTEVQEVMTSSIPAPLAPTPPSFITEPASTNVMARADVSFSVLVAGTAPFSYQWHKDNSTLTGATDATLTLSNVQSSDAGDYHVTVTNGGGTTNSASATLVVTPRPAAPASLAIDFNHREEIAGHTQAGFESFTIDGVGTTSISAPSTRLYGGVEITVAGSNNTPYSSRRRGSPTNAVDFTETLLLTDFIYSAPATGTDGLDVTIKFLEPNTVYSVTLWSFDSQNFGDRVSDWYANGALVRDDYIFEGSAHPTANETYQITFDVASDANGTIKVEGRREASGTNIAVFLNALKVSLPVTRVSTVERVGGNLRLTIETPDSSITHTVEEVGSLPAGSWTGVAGASTTVLSPTSLQIEFPQPVGQTRFYRVSRSQ